MRLIRAALAATLPAAGAAQASPLFYAEDVDGDIKPDGLGHLPMFELNSGFNIVTGTMRMQTRADGSALADLDPFRFTVTQGLRLGNVYLGTNFSDDTGNTGAFEMNWTLFDGARTQSTATCYALVGSLNCVAAPSGGDLFASRGFADTLYELLPIAFAQGIDAGKPYGGSLSYTLAFEVHTVPEPTSLALLCAAGVPALLAPRRRRPAR